MGWVGGWVDGWVEFTPPPPLSEGFFKGRERSKKGEEHSL